MVTNWEDFIYLLDTNLEDSDIYQVAINGFLTMEKEDVPEFVSNLMRLQNKKESLLKPVGYFTQLINLPHKEVI